MKATITRFKKMALVLAGALMAATLLIASAPARATDDDTAALFKSKCAMCHGAKGEGMPATTVAPIHIAYPKLVGRDPRQGFPFGRDPKLVKTVGNYWPYATTVYDYVHRAMPLSAPGTLTPDETYAVVAWLLAENEIIPRDAEMNAKTLPAVKMPDIRQSLKIWRNTR